MRLVASMIVRNEMNRYLPMCIGSLAEFCDEIRVFDDGSTDGTFEWLAVHPKVAVLQQPTSTFFEHEGNARQAALRWTLELTPRPTHILTIDADEFVSDGAALRRKLEHEDHWANPRQLQAWTLDMLEVWRADEDCLCIRCDGGWKAHPVPAVFTVPDRPGPDFRIQNRQLACGRTPIEVNRLSARGGMSRLDVDLLHFGWACEPDRPARHERYAVADGGRFHQSTHLNSILWPDNKVRLSAYDWPSGLAAVHDALVARSNPRTVVG